MGMSILELKLEQELASLEQDLIFAVFLDLSKVYDSFDRGRLLHTLGGYGSGPQLQVLLQEFWDKLQVVTWKGRFHGPLFHTSGGTIQRSIKPPTLFNVTVDNLIRYWMSFNFDNLTTTHDGVR